MSPPATGAQRRVRVLTIGASTSSHCGVHDYASELDVALKEHGCEMYKAWGRLSHDGAPTRGWLNEVSVAIRTSRPDVLLWHYSVFTLAKRGIPVAVPRLTRELRTHGLPIVVVLHEFAYPWARRGWRGAAIALTQRVALVDVLKTATEAVVTTERRAVWLRSRRWLPHPPVHLSPVFATLPESHARGRDSEGIRIVVFGYATEVVHADVVVEGFRAVRSELDEAVLSVAGSGDARGSHARPWLAAANRAQVPITFTGTLPASDLADVLATATVCVFPDAEGPTSRRTTLSNLLQNGCPTIAFVGEEGWPAAINAGAIEVVPVRPDAFCRKIVELALDPLRRRQLSERAKAFYRRELAVEHAAALVADRLRIVAIGSAG